MSDVTTPNRLGQANGAGAVDALFLKIFSGEVLAAFAEGNVFLDKHRVQTQDHGKSMQFIATGRINAAYHTPGADLLLTATNMPQNEVTVDLDQTLTAPVFLPEIDVLMNHWEARQELTTQAGRALAKAFDINVAINLVKAARAASPVTGLPGGARVTDAAMKTDASVLLKSIFAAQTKMDEAEVPEEDRFCALPPALHALLISSSDKAISVDYNPGGNGGVAEGRIYKVAGFTLVKSNHIPSTNVTTGPSKYQVDARTTAGICWQKGAVGTAKLADLKTGVTWIEQNLGWLINARYIMGHGVLTPCCAVELATGAVA